MPSNLEALPAECQNLIRWQERYADGLVTTSEYQVAWKRAEAEALASDFDPPNTLTYATASVGLSNPPTTDSLVSCISIAASAAACAVADTQPDCEYDEINDTARAQEMREQVHLVRDLFGTPSRLVVVDPSWLTSTVLALAEGIYQDRAFDRMPILADALQDTGCDNDNILNHCRSESVHARGCWVVDLVLGKE